MITSVEGVAHDLSEVAVGSRRLGQSAQWRLLVFALLLADTIAITAAFALAYLVRLTWGLPFGADTPPHALFYYFDILLWALPMWLVILAVYHLYDRQYLLGGVREYMAVFNACTIGTVAIVGASFLNERLFFSRGWLVLSWLLALAFTTSARFLVRRIAYGLRRRGFLTDRAIIVGANAEAAALAEHLSGNPTAGLKIVGAVDGGQPPDSWLAGGVPILGRLDDLAVLMRRHDVRELLVAPTAVSREELLELCRTFAQVPDVHMRMSSGLFEMLTTGVSVKVVGGLPLISPEKIRIKGLDAVMKTILDYAGALAGLVVASPLFALFALLIKLDSPGPVFHRRRVLGRGGCPFDALKFRTMHANADEWLARSPELRLRFEQGFKLKDDPRVTRAGRFLRRTSLDGLPQLVNVLVGQMSLVGPRMIAPEEAVRYGKWQFNLLTVKPGITGPWQANGRNELSYDERVSMSMQYIRNYTIWLDLQILLQTIPVVLWRKGAY